MNDVDIQDCAACGRVGVVFGHSSCAKYRQDTSASSSVPSFGMFTDLSFASNC